MVANQRSNFSQNRLANLIAALALANLYFLNLWGELQDHFYDYYRMHPFQTWAIFAKSLGWLLLLAALIWVLIAAAHQLKVAAGRKLACVLLLGVLFGGLDVIRVRALHFYFPALPRALSLLLLAAAGGGVLYLLFFRDRVLFRGIRGMLLFIAFLVPINLAATGWAIYRAWPAESYRDRQAAWITPSAPGPRFIWIIFDEWDQHITFNGRAAGLDLPEVDRFRNEALHAEAVFSPADDTLEAIPSLLTGRIVKKSRPVDPNELMLHYADANQEVPWSAQPNVFRSARQLGVNGAATGFYHPYPRVLGADLVKSSSISSHVLFEEPVYWENVHGLAKFYRLLQSPLHRVPIIQKRDLLGTWSRRQTFGVAFEQVRARAFKLALQPEIGLVFLHFPSPHPPGIYDRAQRRISADSHSTYQDNLALLDRTLGELRREMEAAGQWDDSFILLSSDHPLREKPFHPWVPFLLKMPGQKQGLAYKQPFNSVLTHDLVLAALSHQFHSAQDVATWLDQVHGRFPVTRRHPQPAASNPLQSSPN